MVKETETELLGDGPKVVSGKIQVVVKNFALILLNKEEHPFRMLGNGVHNACQVFDESF